MKFIHLITFVARLHILQMPPPTGLYAFHFGVFLVVCPLFLCSMVGQHTGNAHDAV